MSNSFSLNWNGAEISARVEGASSEALQKAAEFLLEKANEKVPVETGNLRDSGTASVEGDEAVVSYNTPYAVRLHEHPEYNFKTGEGKWLEKALMENESAIQQMLADAMKKGLE